jgi:transposase
MSNKTAKRYTPKRKWELVVKLLKGEDQTQLARQHDIHPVSLSGWKQYALKHGENIFTTGTAMQQLERRNRDLETLIGKKEVEIAVLKNFLTPLD